MKNGSKLLIYLFYVNTLTMLLVIKKYALKIILLRFHN